MPSKSWTSSGRIGHLCTPILMESRVARVNHTCLHRWVFLFPDTCVCARCRCGRTLRCRSSTHWAQRPEACSPCPATTSSTTTASGEQGAENHARGTHQGGGRTGGELTTVRCPTEGVGSSLWRAYQWERAFPGRITGNGSGTG